MDVPGLQAHHARLAAFMAVRIARYTAPKLTGLGAKNIFPIYGDGFFGVHFMEHLWFQNVGVRPQTMRWLAGKTIPMWIDDPTGRERRANPKAKVRTTESGRTQVLIFRRAANFGQRKTVKTTKGGVTTTRDVPMSFPGAPGRIALREAPSPYTTPGRIGGRVARGNIGVRWYFPGLTPRNFLDNALVQAGNYYGVMGSIHTGYNWVIPEGADV
jgi:hypothetical protein